MRGWSLAAVGLLGLLLGWCSLFLWSPLAIGQADVWQGLAGGALGDDAAPAAAIVRELRLPRAACAWLVGACLGIAGALMQGMTRNRLASPSLFGVTAGASLGLALFATGVVGWPWAGGGIAMSLAGGAAAWLAVLTLGAAWTLGDTQGRLVLAGIAVAALCAALTRLTVILVEAQAQGVLTWLAGSFANVEAAGLQALWPCTLVGGVLALGCAPRLNLLALGDEAARSLGVRVAGLRWLVFAVSLLLVAASVVAAGPVGFVGLVAPNIARPLFGQDYRWVVLASAGLGGALVLASDLAGRAVAFPAETPAGVVTALVGAPFFLYLARREA